jgi:hypothetical protein
MKKQDAVDLIRTCAGGRLGALQSSGRRVAVSEAGLSLQSDAQTAPTLHGWASVTEVVPRRSARDSEYIDITLVFTAAEPTTSTIGGRQKTGAFSIRTRPNWDGSSCDTRLMLGALGALAGYGAIPGCYDGECAVMR